MTAPVRGGRAVFAMAVRRERRARGWTQTVLANKAGISPATVFNIERMYSSPRLDVVTAIAEALGVTVGFLADGRPDHG